MSKPRALTIIAVLAMLSIAGAVRAQAPPPEGIRLRELPAPSPHWVFVESAINGTLQSSSVTIVDGDSQQVLGMMTGGLVPTFAIAPDHRQFYMANTFYSRGAYGDRTDVAVIYDGKKLAPAGEVVLPPKRQLFLPDSSALATTPDGRFLLSANMTPATSVSIVDLARRKFLGEIDITGCTEILISGPRQFASVCGDGTILTTQFDDSGKAAGAKRTAAPFFDPETDPVFGVPAFIGKQANFISYHGTIYPVDLSSAPAVAGKPWPLLSKDEIAQGWRPGGTELISAHQGRGLLYVLMHQGGEWTHNQPGVEVWVYDANQHKRVDRLALPTPADALLVTQDADPLLFALAQGTALAPGGAPSRLQIFSALKGRYLGQVRGLFGLPNYMFGI